MNMTMRMLITLQYQKNNTYLTHLDAELAKPSSPAINNDIQYNHGSFIDLQDENTNKNEQEEEDHVIAVFQSVIEQLKDNEGLDSYQVLAFVAMDPKLRRMKVKRPLSKFNVIKVVLDSLV